MSDGATDAIVDVGIPTLGTRPFLSEAVASVMAQTISSWRLVVSENGPGSAAVREVMEPYLSDARVSLVSTGKPVGIGESHTNAFRGGTAPYVATLHDDDRWHPGFLERRVALLEQHRACGFVYSGYVMIDEDGNPLGRTRLKLPPGMYSRASFLPKLCRGNFIGPPSTVVIRRSAYEAVGARYRDVLLCDWELFLRLAARFDVGVLGVWDADYRIHGYQLSTDRANLADAQFPALASLEDVALPPASRRLMFAEAHARCALDAVERGERRTALGHLGRAVQADPLAAVRPIQAGRMLAAVAGLVGGERARRALVNERDDRWRSVGPKGLLAVAEDDAETSAP